MSIKYDLLNDQINAINVVLDPYGTLADDEIQSLKGVLVLLEYIKNEKDCSNLNVWEDEADHAANEFVEQPSDVEKFYTILANKDGYVAFNWHWSDIQDRAKGNDIDLTMEDAMDILMVAHRRHDCEQGINWDVLDCHIESFIADKQTEG